MGWNYVNKPLPDDLGGEERNMQAGIYEKTINFYYSHSAGEGKKNTGKPY